MAAGTLNRRQTRTIGSDEERARRRAAFIATIRRTSTAVSVAVTRPAGTVRAATQIIEAKPTRVEIRPTIRCDAATVVAEPTRVDPAPGPRPTPSASPAPASPPSAAAAPAPAGARLYREEALRHRLSAEEGRGVVRVTPPWTWALLWCVVAALVAAVGTSFVGQVEVTSRGRGIVRPTKGVRALTAQMTGVVARVEVRSGERVRAGATLLRIESPSAQAELLQADRELDAVRTQYAAFAGEVDRRYAEQVELLRGRARRISGQVDSLRRSAGQRQRRVDAEVQLQKKGFSSDMGVANTREELADVERQISAAEQGLDQTRQELAALEARRQDELWQREQLVRAAQTKRDSLALVLRQAVVTAPEDGVVEALTVKPGEAVQAGQAVGKVIPTASPLQVVSFLAERDRAFVKPGDEVLLELDQLPYAEYGTLRARIERIGDDLAAPQDLREAFGDEAQRLEAAAYRVELRITDAGPADAAGVKLRSGTLMNVRYTLRRQKLVTLVFSPLRRWFR